MVADILPGFYPSVYTAAAVRFLSDQTGRQQCCHHGTLENDMVVFICFSC